MKKLFTLVVILFPILSLYKTPIPGVDIATLFALMFIPFLIINNEKISINKPLIIMLFYTILSTFLSLWFQSSVDDSMIFFRLGKLVILIVVFLLWGFNSYFDSSYALKTLRIVTLAATFYVVLQSVSQHFFYIVLPRAIYSLLVDSTHLVVQLIDLESAYSSNYRPSAFFLEPAHFSQYVLVYLAITLFGINRNSYFNLRWKEALFISLGIILSRSGMGIILASLLWFLFAVKVLISKRINKKHLLIVFTLSVITLISLFFLRNHDFIIYALNRVFATDDVGYNAIQGRIGGYVSFLELNTLYQLIGVGYGTINGTYFNGLSSTLYWSGILGIIPMLYILIDAFIKGENFQKIFVLIYFILLSFAGVYGALLCFYLPLLYMKFDSSNIQLKYKRESILEKS